MTKPRASRSLLVSAEFTELIGDICVLWNLIEAYVARLLLRYFDHDERKATAISNALGNQSRVDLLSYMVEHYEKDSQIADLINHFIAAFSICRENRNIIVHGAVSLKEPIDIKFLEKPSRSKIGGMVRYAYDLEKIETVHQDIYNLLLFVTHLALRTIFNKVREQQNQIAKLRDPAAPQGPLVALPSKPPLPSRLIPLPPEVRPSE